MFFTLSKITSFLTFPFTWVVVLLLLSFFWKKEVVKRKLWIASIVVLLFFSNGFILDEVMRYWEVQAIKQNEIPANITTAIILGGNVSYDESLDRVQIHRSADRLMQTVDLYKKGIVKKIIFTGGSASLVYKHKREAFYAKRLLLNLGVKMEDIYIEYDSKNTYENAIFTKAITEKEFPAQTFLLVTSAFHMRRSIQCFEKAGISVFAYSADRYSGPRKFYLDHLLLPNAEALAIWNIVIHEIVGTITYKIKGYI
ncbi:MAG: YdcF family protein [Bacteroidetes bacterium]|nr:YdcF family protein [Bacteroidota bacterium]